MPLDPYPDSLGNEGKIRRLKFHWIKIQSRPHFLAASGVWHPGRINASDKEREICVVPVQRAELSRVRADVKCEGSTRRRSLFVRWKRGVPTWDRADERCAIKIARLKKFFSAPRGERFQRAMLTRKSIKIKSEMSIVASLLYKEREREIEGGGRVREKFQARTYFPT